MRFIYTAMVACALFLTAGCSNSEVGSTNNTQAEAAQNNTSETQTTQATSKKETYKSPLPDTAPTIKAVTTGTTSPFSFQDEFGDLQGIDIDIIRAIGENEGFKVDFYADIPKNVLSSLDSGERDIALDGINYTPERDSQYGLSEPYFFNPSAIAYLSSRPKPIESVAQLVSLKVGVMEDAKQHRQMEAQSGVVPVPFENGFLAYQAMVRGEVDAVAYDMPPLQHYAKEYPSYQVTIFPYETQENKNSNAVIVVAKSNTELLQKINHGIQTIKQNGKLAEIEKKWLSSNAN